ncbi:conserved hypothetical protein, partial [Ixodes scapularis]
NPPSPGLTNQDGYPPLPPYTGQSYPPGSQGYPPFRGPGYPPAEGSYTFTGGQQPPTNENPRGLVAPEVGYSAMQY